MKAIIYILFFVSITSCNKQLAKKSSKFETQKSVDSTNLIKEEKNLLKIHNAILETFANNRNDSLIALNSRKFTDSITHLIQKNANTFHYPFELLQKENALNLITSPDKKLRVYSWDNHLGGTMRFFNQIFQFQSNNQIATEIHLAEQDPQAFFSKIYEAKNDKETFYLVISNSILWSSYHVQHINAYKIADNKLQDVSIFKTKKELLSSISVEFDFVSVVERSERPVELIKFEGNILKIALVDNNQNVTNKNLIYEWNGNLFTYIGVK